jgi:hypothetical protein
MMINTSKAFINALCLFGESEPAIRYKLFVGALGKDERLAEVQRARLAIKTSATAQRLLAEREPRPDDAGEIPHHPYAKWYGAHWVLAALADLGYPGGDETLIPLREQELNWLLGATHQEQIRTIAGRVRRCASQEGNALYALLALGLADSRADELAARLCRWQWPDGGWNCDKRPAASHSSFMESLIPLRALALHVRITGNQQSQQAVERAAEIFLKRQLFKQQHDGRVIDSHFTRLHYPCYWHYDILFALKVLAEAGLIDDPRCQAALDLLESKRLADGGFAAEERYYRTTGKRTSGYSLVDWGGVNQRLMNPWVTVDTLFVLRAAGRLCIY